MNFPTPGNGSSPTTTVDLPPGIIDPTKTPITVPDILARFIQLGLAVALILSLFFLLIGGVQLGFLSG